MATNIITNILTLIKQSEYIIYLIHQQIKWLYTKTLRQQRYFQMSYSSLILINPRMFTDIKYCDGPLRHIFGFLHNFDKITINQKK